MYSRLIHTLPNLRREEKEHNFLFVCWGVSFLVTFPNYYPHHQYYIYEKWKFEKPDTVSI